MHRLVLFFLLLSLVPGGHVLGQVPDTLRQYHDQLVLQELSLELPALIHPVTIAMQEWQVLAIDEEQMREIQALERELKPAGRKRPEGVNE
jgi:hypothetical protein